MKDYEVGVTAPPFHVYCRSCTCPYFDDNYGERAARNADGDTYYVPSDMTYNNWKKSFVDGKPEGLKKIDANEIKLDELEKQFSDLTDGYKYDDFINDFGSIDEGFEGASDEEIKKAKELAEQIEAARAQTGYIKSDEATREDAIEALNSMGIKFKDSTSSGTPDETVGKISDFISEFEQSHSNYFNNNKLQLKSIEILDEETYIGQHTGGSYTADTQSINLVLKMLNGKNPSSKLVTYSNSDDWVLHTPAHEYGHYIADTLKNNFGISDYDVIQNSMLRYFEDDILKGDIFKAKPQNLIEALSSYGATSSKEAFAEAFAEAYTTKNPRRFAQIFKEELESVMSTGKIEWYSDVIEGTKEQIDLLKQYGNLNNLALFGKSDDIIRWGELQKITGKNATDILGEIAKTSNEWEFVLANQDARMLQSFSNQLLDEATDAELSALRLWTGETYSLINRYKRYGDFVDEISRDAADKIEKILGRIETSQDLIVKRGTGTKKIFEK